MYYKPTIALSIFILLWAAGLALAQTNIGGAPINPGFLVTSSIDSTATASHWISFGGNVLSTTQADVDSKIPMKLMCSDMQVDIAVAPGAGDTWSFALEDDGSATLLLCLISGASAVDCSDSNESIILEAGSIVRTVVTESGTALDPDRWFISYKCREVQ